MIQLAYAAIGRNTPPKSFMKYGKSIKDGMSDDQILENLNDELYAVKLENGNFLIAE